jgi:hypothetical protein
MANKAGGAASPADDAADILGTWALQVSTPFGTQPITFEVTRAGAELHGVMRHERGAADVSDIKVHGAEFSGLASITLKGTRITADVEGRINGAQMDGIVRVHLPIAPPVKFTGIKQ